MTSVYVPVDLPRLVKEKFDAAKEAGDLSFWPTKVAILKVNDFSFQLRFCPSLANKPKSEKPKDGKKPTDPFLDPPEPLLITELSPSHILVLNKFAIVPEHFILATKSFKEQTHLLDPEDLSAALACLNVWQANGQELFGFFNSGEHSGASQPHRHLQFLPVESMMLGVPNGAWKPLVDDLVSSSELDLPFTFFKTPIPQSATPKQLHELYLSLHEQACVAVNAYLNTKSGTVPNLQSSKSGSSPISYNLGLTHKSMVLCPRRAEGMLLEGDHEVKVKSSMVALNGTMLGGTLLVKSDFEWDLLRKDESRLKMVLEACGFPSPTQGETTTGRL